MQKINVDGNAVKNFNILATSLIQTNYFQI